MNQNTKPLYKLTLAPVSVFGVFRVKETRPVYWISAILRKWGPRPFFITGYGDLTLAGIGYILKLTGMHLFRNRIKVAYEIYRLAGRNQFTAKTRRIP